MTINRTLNRRRAAGFSLLELMLVVVIMGLLMGVVIVNLRGAGDKAKRGTTIALLRQIQSALDGYSAEFGTYPPTEMGLTPLVTTKALKIEPLDAWKHKLRYYFPGTSGNPDRPFDLVSAGADGVFSTGGDLASDDLDIWRIEQQDAAPPTP